MHTAPARSIQVPIVGNRPTWLALVPKAAPAIKLSPPSASVARGQALTLSVAAPAAAGLHAVYVTVTTPTGDTAEWLGGEVMVGPKGASCVLPVAYNDPAGQWKVTATDMYTGKATTVSYTVK